MTLPPAYEFLLSTLLGNFVCPKHTPDSNKESQGQVTSPKRKSETISVMYPNTVLSPADITLPTRQGILLGTIPSQPPPG